MMAVEDVLSAKILSAKQVGKKTYQPVAAESLFEVATVVSVVCEIC